VIDSAVLLRCLSISPKIFFLAIIIGRFVDDDAMLRKMFGRVLNSVAPQWKMTEASNGETALRLVDEEDFDLIFVDQYM
jgi:response regulator of citrate/malate metabolism